MTLTAAQLRENAYAQEVAHTQLKDMSFDAACVAVEAHLLSRPDVDPQRLEALAQRLSRAAWSAMRYQDA